MLSKDHTPDHVQAFRPIHKSQKPFTASASLDSGDVTFIDCHTDLETHVDYILWADIQREFGEALLVTHRTKMLPFLKGPEYQTLEPRRIATVPGIVLDVVVGGKLPFVDVRIIQDLSLSTPPSSRTPQNPVYSLEEQTVENYDHIERPATPPLSFQEPEVISTRDQQEGDGGYRASSENQPPAGTTSAQKCDGSQENGAATSMDLMQTMIRASQGDADAQVALGDRYKKGDGVDRDRRAALDWYLTAAEQGHAHAQYNIGLLLCAVKSVECMIYDQHHDDLVQNDDDFVHDNGDSELDGDDVIPRNKHKALEWLLKAAHQGLAAAQFAAAMSMLADSDYDQANPDPVTGWARKAADQKHVLAQWFMLGIYMRGIEPEARSQMLELHFKTQFNRSGGCVEYLLGRIYMDSDVMHQGSRAFELFVNGAEQGSDMAQYEVARCYEEGRGVSTNYEKAIDWYTKASQQGHRQAKRDLGRLTAKLEKLSVGDATGLCVGVFYSVVVMVVGVIVLQTMS